MPKQIPVYVGDDAIKAAACALPLSGRRFTPPACACGAPSQAHCLKSRRSPCSAGLWKDEAPPFADVDEANAFFQDMMSFLECARGIAGRLAAAEAGEDPQARQSRRDPRREAALRVEELLDGFLQGFTGGEDNFDVPQGVGARVHHIERAIEMMARWRNTFTTAGDIR